jgi:hypothetical protein
MFGGNCTGPCPDGFLKLIGITDMNNMVTPHDDAFDYEGYMVELEFFVTADRNFIGTCLEVGFCSYDCDDNVISNALGDRVAIPLSGVHYGPDYDLQECLEGKTDVYDAEQKIDFFPGWICVCPPPDDRGDINLNGIANEIGDAVLFTNYFMYGDVVWDATYFENQILATDINNDGWVLTAADLVYLIGIITGDLDPFPESGEGGRITPFVNSVDVMTDMRSDRAVVTMNSTEEIGAAFLVYNYSGTVGTPTLDESSPMKIRSRAHNGELRVLVYSFDRSTFNGAVNIPVDGELELIESSISDMSGSLLTVNATARSLPTTFSLDQNYPNPFNAGTVIRFALPDATDWNVNIYNVAGQLVRSFNGFSDAGYVSVNWDATNEAGADVASGVYFYRVSAADKTATKKMMLVK